MAETSAAWILISSIGLIALGTGRYGRVRLVKHVPSGEFFALKICPRDKLTREDQIRHALSERRVHGSISHPYIVKLYRTFKDDVNLYMLFEYVPGGELFSVLRSYRVLNERAARFYAAQIVLMLEYLHSKDIIYRDLKPENLLLDKQGYLKMVDMGFAKQLEGGRTLTRCGTPEYRAPEIIRDAGHGKPVDWWTLGVLIYEMLVGASPFNPSHSENKAEIYQNILRGSIKFPSILSVTARDVIRLFLNQDPNKRLGFRGAQEVKNHSFFMGINWDKMLAKLVNPPIPLLHSVQMEGDTTNFDRYSEYDDMSPGKPMSEDGTSDPFAEF